MLNTFLVALATLFATVGVADIAFIFAALTKDNTPAERFAIATRGVLVATGILLVFGLIGNAVLDVFGITIPALRTAGGILLLLIAIDMVFARHSGATGTTTEEEVESRQRNDISVFPLAMPLLAGPGAIATVLTLSSDATSWRAMLTLLAAVVIVGAVIWVVLASAGRLERLVGTRAQRILLRFMGLILAAVGAELLLRGVYTFVPHA
jgi:multiple antibiotic resistance protein